MDFASIANNTIIGSTQSQSTDNGATTASGSESSSSAQAEEFDTFLELLTAQIRNQDPLAPLDSTQFVEQLATFSNLELQAKNNQILESIATMLASQIAAESDTTA